MAREWRVGLTVQCVKCGAVDDVLLGSTSAEDARTNAMKVLRYRGWSLAGRQKILDLCPEHAPPLRKCELCAEPTPAEYAHDTYHVTGVKYSCLACLRAQLDLRMKERV